MRHARRAINPPTVLPSPNDAFGLWDNPLFLHEMRLLRRAPVKVILAMIVIVLALIVAGLVMKTMLLTAAQSPGPGLLVFRSAILSFINHAAYILPVIPLIYFVRRMDHVIRGGLLAGIAQTPMKTEAILAGWLGAGLAWGVMWIGLLNIPMMTINATAISDPVIGAMIRVLAHSGAHAAEMGVALLAGLPLALYLSLSHRHRVNVMLLTAAFAAGIMFLLQNSVYILHLMISGSFRNRGVIVDHWLRIMLSVGLHGGLGLLFLMKAGAQLSGYYIEKMESGPAGKSGKIGTTMRPREIRSFLLWPVKARNPWAMLGFVWCVLAAALWILPIGDVSMFLFIYPFLVALMFVPVWALTLSRLPVCWMTALKNRCNVARGEMAPAGSVGALPVFKAIHHPLFHLNFATGLMSAGLCYVAARWVVGAGFYVSYHLAITLPISVFLVVMLAQLAGSYLFIMDKPMAAGRIRKMMSLLAVLCFMIMTLAGIAINHFVVHSESMLSIWAWVLTFSLAVVFPLAAWLNLLIERRLRGARFLLNRSVTGDGAEA